MPAVPSVLAMLAVQRTAMPMVAEASLCPLVLQVSARPVAVLAATVCLVMLLGGLAMLLVFVYQHTPAAAPKVVLVDGQLRYLPPPISALLRHCCGQWPVAEPDYPQPHVAAPHMFLHVSCPCHLIPAGNTNAIQVKQLPSLPPNACLPWQSAQHTLLYCMMPLWPCTLLQD